MQACLSMVEGSSDMRKLTSSMRAVFSARSMLRAIQNRFSAVRLSMGQRSKTQVSLVPPPWHELTTSEPLRKAHAGQAAGHDARLLAGEHEGPQVDVARRDLAADEGRRRWRARASAGRCNWPGSRITRRLERLALGSAVEAGPISMP